MSKQFIIIRGLPGSGKSTLAKKLAGENGKIFSTDDFFMVDGEYLFNRDLLGTAHKWNQDRALKAIKEGVEIVIIDNTNTTLKEIKDYYPHIYYAIKNKYEFKIAIPDTSWAFDLNELNKKNTHNVPIDVINRMLARFDKTITEKMLIENAFKSCSESFEQKAS